MKETWKKVIGFSNYEVSNTGKVRSIDSIRINSLGHKRFIRGKELKPFIDKDGYYKFLLYKSDGTGWKTRKSIAVHRIMALSFMNNAEKYNNVIRHLDGNPSNNNLNNLKWGTAKENYQDMLDHGTRVIKIGCDSKLSKLKQNDIIDIKNLKGKCTQKEVAEKYNVSRITIYRIWTGKRYV
jgi:hypothetical protein